MIHKKYRRIKTPDKNAKTICKDAFNGISFGR
jgi:hypothetical protein